MSDTDPARRPSVLLSFQFGGTALVGSLAMALVSAFAPPAAQVAVLGALVSVLVGLFVSYMGQEDRRERRRDELVERLAVPLALAPEHELYEQYLAMCRGLTELARQTDPVLRDIAVLKLASLAGEIGSLADGKVEFGATEAWRTVYERLLGSPGVKEYRSVAWVRGGEYWRDQPGRQSMQVNFEAAHRGVLIERIVILPDALWPASQPLPSDDILPWIREQHDHGLWVTLVRDSEVDEPDLLADFGIYGDRAVGVGETDDRSRTVRFTLTFDPQAVRVARERWRRLSIYATSFRSLLDRLTDGP